MDLVEDFGFDIDDIIDYVQRYANDEMEMRAVVNDIDNVPPCLFHHQGYAPFLSSSPESTSTTSFSNAATPPRQLSVVPAPTLVQKPRSKKDRLPKVIREAFAPKKCAICGGATRCFHYDVASCHSCKAFFRRSVLKRANYACKAEGRCEVAAGVRCRSCRYDRCILAGMNVESIQLTETEIIPILAADLEERRKGLVERKQPKSTIQAVMASDLGLETRLVTELLYLESKAKRLRESAFDPRELYVTDIRGLLKKPIELGNADKYEKPPEWPLTMAQLEAERPKKWPPSCDILDKSKFKYPHWPTIDLLLSIDMAKALPVFQKLEVDDQEALLRHVALVNSIITQAFYSRHYNETTLTYPNGFQPIGLRKRFIHFVRPVPEQLEYDVFCRTLEPLMRVGLTVEEYVLLKALVYCLDVCSLSGTARKLLNQQSQMYARALLRHVQSNLGELAGAKKYAEIVTLVDTFMHFAKRLREFQVFVMTFGPFPEPSKVLGWAARA